MNNLNDTLREGLVGTAFAEGPEGELPSGQEVASPNIINKPKLIISSYTINPEMVEAGKDFNLALTLYNTNNKNTIYNLKVSLDQNLQSQPQEAGGDNSPLVSDGSVFSPVASSNTFYESAIYPWNTVTKNIKLHVLPNATAGNYVMGVKLEYEDYLGNQYETTESIGIPVVQKAQITTGDVNVEDPMVGEPTSVSLNIYNTGKDKLSTFMCKVEGKGFTVDNDSHFIGNFAPGATETFSFNLTPSEEGEAKGTIILGYEDSTGKAHLEKKEFKFEAQAAMQEGATDENGNPIDPETGELIGQADGGDMGEGPLGGHLNLVIGGAIVIVLLILFFRRRKKKAQKKEEELTIDDL